MMQAPPVEAVEAVLREAGNLVVFAYTVDFVPLDKIFVSRYLKTSHRKPSKSLIQQARKAPETLPPLLALRSKPHPGFFAVAQRVDLYKAAKIARLAGLWTVIVDKWVSVAEPEDIYQAEAADVEPDYREA